MRTKPSLPPLNDAPTLDPFPRRKQGGNHASLGVGPGRHEHGSRSAHPPDPHDTTPAAGGRAPVVQDDRLFVAELADRVGRCAAGSSLATVLALLALGLAAWALLTQEEEQDAQAGASRSQVEALDARVDDLESRIDDRATKESVSDLRADQEELSDQVEKLADDAGKSDDTEALPEVRRAARRERPAARPAPPGASSSNSSNSRSSSRPADGRT